MIAFAMCGSFCTHAAALEQLKTLKNAGEEIIPVFSENVWLTDTRFGTAKDLQEKVIQICQHPIVHTIPAAEPFGPQIPLEILIICPCTGNTLAKIAAGITDTPVTMAAKAQMRQGKPILIALSTNDGLGSNLYNLALLLNKKNVFFVPLLQDDPVKKPFSLSADFQKLQPALESARKGEQLRPLFRV